MLVCVWCAGEHLSAAVARTSQLLLSRATMEDEQGLGACVLECGLQGCR